MFASDIGGPKFPLRLLARASVIVGRLGLSNRSALGLGQV